MRILHPTLPETARPKTEPSAEQVFTPAEAVHVCAPDQKQDALIRQNSEEIKRLAGELSGLRQALKEFMVAREKEANLVREKLSALPTPTPAPVQAPAAAENLVVPMVPLEALAAPEKTVSPAPVPAPVSAPPPLSEAKPAAVPVQAAAPDSKSKNEPKIERKIAFHSRLWDYLNQAAFETSKRNTPRTK